LIEFVGHFFRDGFARCVFLCAANPTFFPILLSDKNHEKDTLEDHEKITNHFFIVFPNCRFQRVVVIP